MKIKPPDAAKAEQIRQLREELLTVEEERLCGVTDHTLEEADAYPERIIAEA